MDDAHVQLHSFEFKIQLQEHMTREDVIEELRLLANAMSTQKALADKIGVSSSYLSDVLSGRREPGPRVLKFLKLKKTVVYTEAKD